MVMESPSPQCVGREFVRQYYTLMNEAPGFLHRFYSCDSSFVHSGGVDLPSQEAEPVYGQKDIHKKIQELNFVDCHTKIRQVDSQATVGNGVVVQVTGELSNHGGTMRRFMQTFVLAHQTPKQYYVHNDIFRYQDEVFHDSYESEDEPEQQQSAITEPGLENGAAAEPAAAEHGDEEVPERITTPTLQEFDEQQNSPAASPQAAAEIDFQATSPAEKSTEQQPEPPKATIEPPKATIAPPKTTIEQPKTEEAPEQSTGNRAADQLLPNSWAKIAGGGGGSSPVPAVPPMSTSGTSNKQTVVSLSVITSQQKEEESTAPTPSTPSTPTAPVQDDQQQTSQNAPRANRPNTEPAAASARHPPRSDYQQGGDRRANERFPDNQQVFVGNLPQDVAEFQLKRFFNGYGKVVDMRINRGGGANGKVPFGFVVFDNEEPVKELLKLKRVEMNGHRLNVEEKKARTDRAGSNSRMPRGARQQQQQRAGSRPKDRESSGSRSENRATHGRKVGRP